MAPRRARHRAHHHADGDDVADGAGRGARHGDDDRNQIASNYRDGQEALYAADAGVDRVVQDLLMVPRWNDILAGGLRSGFIDTTATPTLPGGGEVLNLAYATAALQAETNTANLWGANNPTWRLYAAGPLADLLPNDTIDSQLYIAVWVADNQINKELYSAYLYLSMSAHFEAANFPGFAKWTRKQANEEKTHAMKFYDFIYDRGGRVVLQVIDQPPVEFGTPLEIFQEIYAPEQKVTGLLNNIYALALKENDYPSQLMLHWFIDEQVEEEKNASVIVEQLKMVGDAPGGLMLIDRAVGERG